MTEQELSDIVLEAIYERKDQSSISLSEIASDKNVVFKNAAQKERIIDFLEENGYIRSQMYIGGDGDLEITSRGVQKIEDAISKGLEETDKLMREGGLELDLSEDDEIEMTPIVMHGVNELDEEVLHSEAFLSSYVDVQYQDSSVAPCFKVEDLAKLFVSQIDKISHDVEHENICMLGVFGPWGRGKTYFFEKIEKELEKLEETYITATFNAWKYQETPAIWAYIYEVLSKNLHSKWYAASCYRIKRLIQDFWSEFCSNLLPWVLGLLVYVVFCIVIHEVDFESFGESKILVYLAPFLGTFYKKYYSSPFRIVESLTKKMKSKSFSNYLGLQNEIEHELEELLKYYIGPSKTHKKLLLYVDDIDRCPHEKMVQIIDYFRTVLENQEIKKRLVVVCSVDASKLKSALRNKYRGLYEGDDVAVNKSNLDKMIKEQFDKLFFSGIGLPRLTSEQQIEYLITLSNAQRESENMHVAGNTEIVRAGSTPNEVVRNATRVHVEEVTEDILSKKIFEVISKSDEELTPRQLRIIYYRIVLANNILSMETTGRVYKDALLQAIVKKSISSDESENDEYKNIIDMVVPY